MALCAASHGDAFLFDLLYLFFFPPSLACFFVSSLTVTPLFAFPLCLLLDVKLAHTTPFQSSPIHHILSGIPGFTQLSNGIRDRF